MPINRTKLSHPGRRCLWLCLGSISLLLAACAPLSSDQPSAMQPQGKFTVSGEAQLPVQWWT
ncbi:MAG: hypothetical protein ACSLFH_04065, partial [Desulfuromonadales bacterium]